MSFLTSLSILRSFFLNHYAENSPQSTFDRVLHENPGAAVFMSQIRFLPMRWESVNSLYSTPGLRPCRKEGRWWRAEVLSSRAEDTQERKEMVTWRSTELQGWGHPGRKGDGDVEKRWAPGLRTPRKEGRWWRGEALNSRAEDTQEGREMVTWRSAELQGWGHLGRKGNGDVEKRWAPGLRIPRKEGRWWQLARCTAEGHLVFSQLPLHCWLILSAQEL